MLNRDRQISSDLLLQPKYVAAYGKVDMTRGETFEDGQAEIDAVLGRALSIAQPSQLVILYFDVNGRTSPLEQAIAIGDNLIAHLSRHYPTVAWTLSVSSASKVAARRSDNLPPEMM